MIQDLEQQISDIDRQIGQVWREHQKYSGAIPQTEEERQSWPKKIQSLMKNCQMS